MLLMCFLTSNKKYNYKSKVRCLYIINIVRIIYVNKDMQDLKQILHVVEK